MRLRKINPWDLSPSEAIAVQKRLAVRIRGGKLPKLNTVLGLDVSYRRETGTFTASAALLSWPDLVVQDAWRGEGTTPFPYVPGLLSFREIPPLLPLLRSAPKPDLILVDGHGIAHPRGLGLASHLGLVCMVPTIGCAKSLLVGEYAGLGDGAGSAVPLLLSGRTVGYALRSKAGCKPLFVSPGNLLDPKEACKGVMLCLKRYRLPEPIRIADKLSKGTTQT